MVESEFDARVSGTDSPSRSEKERGGTAAICRGEPTGLSRVDLVEKTFDTLEWNGF